MRKHSLGFNVIAWNNIFVWPLRGSRNKLRHDTDIYHWIDINMCLSRHAAVTKQRYYSHGRVSLCFWPPAPLLQLSIYSAGRTELNIEPKRTIKLHKAEISCWFIIACRFITTSHDFNKQKLFMATLSLKHAVSYKMQHFVTTQKWFVRNYVLFIFCVWVYKFVNCFDSYLTEKYSPRLPRHTHTHTGTEEWGSDKDGCQWGLKPAADYQQMTDLPFRLALSSAQLNP